MGDGNKWGVERRLSLGGRRLLVKFVRTDTVFSGCQNLH